MMDTTRTGMTAKKIGYWVSTVMVALILLPGGVFQVTLQRQNVEGFIQLGYPVYFMVLLGVWKLLGGIALLVPRFPRVKEWAYAGAFIDFSSASVSCAATGGSAGHVIAPIACIAILFASWALRPESRTLGTLFPARA
jgi:DoxX-like family